MKRIILLIAALSAAALLFVCSAVGAYDLGQIQTEFWAGDGANEALLVVDFWPYNGQSDSFAFGCRFDGSITGFELLDGVQAANQGFSYAQDGGFLKGIWYTKGETTYQYVDGWPDSWFAYCTSEDYGETWTFDWAVPASRTLGDGDCDGWSAQPFIDWETEPLKPVTPLVPEPASVTALALGVAAALARRRW